MINISVNIAKSYFQKVLNVFIENLSRISSIVKL